MSLPIGALGIALVTMVAAAATEGCGATTGGSSNTGGQAGSRAEADAGAEAASETGGGGGGGGGGGDVGAETGPACVPIGNVATVNAGPLWGCFQQACARSLTACAADCVCNNGIVAALTCVAVGGTQTTCFFAAATTLGSNPNAIALLGCLATARTCLVIDAGSDAGAAGPTRDSASGAEAGGDAASGAETGDASSSGHANEGGADDGGATMDAG